MRYKQNDSVTCIQCIREYNLSTNYSTVLIKYEVCSIYFSTSILCQLYCRLQSVVSLQMFPTVTSSPKMNGQVGRCFMCSRIGMSSGSAPSLTQQSYRTDNNPTERTLDSIKSKHVKESNFGQVFGFGSDKVVRPLIRFAK